jgi:HK97 family phage major capsid protein
MSTQALRERIAALKKEANHLLAEKGAQVWTKEDQAKFDNLVDEADRAETQLAAHQRVLDKDAEDSYKDVQRNRPAKKMTAAQKAVDIFLRKSAREMTAEEALEIRNTMSTTTGSEGGFSVASEVAATYVDLQKAFAFMRAVSAQITTSRGGPLGYPTSDGTSETGELVAQNASAAAADPTFGTRDLATYKFGSKIIAVPIELLQDSMIDVQAMVFKRARDRIGRIQNTYFTTGTGTSQPTGLITAASVGKTGTTGQTLTIIYDDLVDLVDSVDAAYLHMQDTEPAFMTSQTMRRVIRKIKDTGGRPIWTPSYDEGLASAMPDRLLGYPLYLNNDIAVPAANAKSLAFGQLGNYMIRDALEVNLFRFDDSVYVSKGQIGFLAWARSGGNLLDINSVKLYQHSAT